MPSFKDLTGKQYGILVVNKCVGRSARGAAMWECSCECGNTPIVKGTKLTEGRKKSCGCGWVKHGQTQNGEVTTEYNSFAHAKDRCHNPNTDKWKDYGGRGIEFRFDSFKEFIEELGPRPAGTTVDRINTNGHYEKGNVKWSTPKEQANNCRSNRFHKAMALVEQQFIELLKAA